TATAAYALSCLLIGVDVTNQNDRVVRIAQLRSHFVDQNALAAVVDTAVVLREHDIVKADIRRLAFHGNRVGLRCSLTGLIGGRQRHGNRLRLGLRRVLVEVERLGIERRIGAAVIGYGAFGNRPLVGNVSAASRASSLALQLSNRVVAAAAQFFRRNG